MGKKPSKKYPEPMYTCQFCQSRNYDAKTKTCRDCGTVVPETRTLGTGYRTRIFFTQKDRR